MALFVRTEPHVQIKYRAKKGPSYTITVEARTSEEVDASYKAIKAEYYPGTDFEAYDIQRWVS
jgi:hypothetical protein